MRGKNGGVRLAGPPRGISVGAVVRQMEPGFQMVECFNYRAAHCAALPVCGLRPAFDQAAEAFLRTLDEYTLADAVAVRDRDAWPLGPAAS